MAGNDNLLALREPQEFGKVILHLRQRHLLGLFRLLFRAIHSRSPWRQDSIVFAGLCRAKPSHPSICKTPLGFDRIVRNAYPGCAARPWAVLCHAFGVKTNAPKSGV